MSALRRTRTVRFLVAVAKWLLVAWLLSPLRGRMHLAIDFTRSALGILLFLIFAGKMFYDSVIWKQVTGRSRGTAADLLSLAAMVLIIAMLVAVTVFFIGLYITNLLPGQMRPEPEL
jgi:hypothetical protein